MRNKNICPYKDFFMLIVKVVIIYNSPNWVEKDKQLITYPYYEVQHEWISKLNT